MRFTKVQGAGNDFVLLEAGDTSRDWAGMARAMCDRHFGIGADGLLLVMPSKVADFRMRMFNPDGSEAEACGNGLRCSAKYVLEKGLVSGKGREITAETLAGIRTVRYSGTGGKIGRVQVSMGNPEFRADRIPVVVESGVGKGTGAKPILDYPVTVNGERLSLSFVSMGNPHAVCFLEKPVSEFPLAQLGPKVEHHKMFPGRVNFEIVNVINRGQLEARVWERGAGETPACGTGACAIAVIAHLQGYIDNKVRIKVPGGTLEVEWDGKGEVFLSGPAETVFTGEWSHEVQIK